MVVIGDHHPRHGWRMLDVTDQLVISQSVDAPEHLRASSKLPAPASPPHRVERPWPCPAAGINFAWPTLPFPNLVLARQLHRHWHRWLLNWHNFTPGAKAPKSVCQTETSRKFGKSFVDHKFLKENDWVSHAMMKFAASESEKHHKGYRALLSLSFWIGNGWRTHNAEIDDATKPWDGNQIRRFDMLHSSAYIAVLSARYAVTRNRMYCKPPQMLLQCNRHRIANTGSVNSEGQCLLAQHGYSLSQYQPLLHLITQGWIDSLIPKYWKSICYIYNIIEYSKEV